MLRCVLALVRLVSCLCLVGACVGVNRAAEFVPAVSARPTPSGSHATVESRTLAKTVTPLPTAVRLLTSNPEDIVLRPGDMANGCRMTAEYSTQHLEMTHYAWVDLDVPRRVGGPVGHHVALVRANAFAAESPISIETTVLRYETAESAAIAFSNMTKAAPPQVQSSSRSTE
jgi:hypothetical protein